MADTPPQLAVIKDSGNVIARLNLIFNDSKDTFGLVRSPSDDDAKKIVEFVASHIDSAPNVVFQCQLGIGRSLAAYAAFLKLYGGDPKPALYRGTHNRALYRKMLGVSGQQPDAEPLVSLVVRVKYAPDRMMAFLLSIQRQRYDNWELIFVTDGPNPTAKQLVAGQNDPRIKLIETEKPMGKWGHPYRQLGIDACRGDLIGLSNDDNYYVPGYLEQMVNALEKDAASLAMCAMLHSYSAWGALAPGNDLGSWIASRELVLQTPWVGDSFFYDAHYLKLLIQNANGSTTVVNRPLFIHN
jgi:predicted protein tyrosine phosphatase